MLDALAELNQAQQAKEGDPEIAARVAQYEMAYRMQNIGPRPGWTSPMSPKARHSDMYGPEVTEAGHVFAHNCLLARRHGGA